MGPVEGLIRVEVLHSPGPREVVSVSLVLPGSATVAQALAEAGLASHTGRIGIWGRLVEVSTPLCDGDRVEVYRPLAADPKEARRLRQSRQVPAKKSKR